MGLHLLTNLVWKKGSHKCTGSRLAYLGHVLIEIRHRLVAYTNVTQATGTTEQEGRCWSWGCIDGN